MGGECGNWILAWQWCLFTATCSVSAWFSLLSQPGWRCKLLNKVGWSTHMRLTFYYRAQKERWIIPFNKSKLYPSLYKPKIPSSAPMALQQQQTMHRHLQATIHYYCYHSIFIHSLSLSTTAFPFVFSFYEPPYVPFFYVNWKSCESLQSLSHGSRQNVGYMFVSFFFYCSLFLNRYMVLRQKYIISTLHLIYRGIDYVNI